MLLTTFCRSLQCLCAEYRPTYTLIDANSKHKIYANSPRLYTHMFPYTFIVFLLYSYYGLQKQSMFTVYIYIMHKILLLFIIIIVY